MSADFSTAESFGDEFLEYVEEQGLEFDDIYNADETRLFGELLQRAWSFSPENRRPTDTSHRKND